MDPLGPFSGGTTVGCCGLAVEVASGVGEVQGGRATVGHGVGDGTSVGVGVAGGSVGIAVAVGVAVLGNGVGVLAGCVGGTSVGTDVPLGIAGSNGLGSSGSQ